ncbi:MAG: exodeoxyribonuclease III [Planctomycetota bacterium]|jgi:exodeoxyribonuclease-3|nr:exodeoxyribonuclease III [Planctomycetota bacterium]
MRIATFNCNSIRVRLPAILAWLEKYSPDLLALQETKVRDKDFPRDEIAAGGWHVVYCGEKSYNGVAIIGKREPDEFSFGLEDDDGGSNTRLVRVKIGGLTVVNTYIPHGRALDSEMFDFKLAWFGRLRAYFGKRFAGGGNDLVWVGDLNVARLPMDVYDSKAVWPHVCHCREVIDAFDAVVGWGFEDVFRRHIREAGAYTFWDYRQRGALERNRGWRIDHILAAGPIAGRSVGCRVDIEPRRAERPSDHTFVFADFA